MGRTVDVQATFGPKELFNHIVTVFSRDNIFRNGDASEIDLVEYRGTLDKNSQANVLK